MRKGFYICFLLFGLLCTSVDGIAQTKPTQVHPSMLHLDSSNVKVQPFNKAKLEEYKQQRDFKYDTISPELSLWDRFWLWFWRKIGNLIGDTVRNPISKYFFIGNGVAIVAFILYKVIGAEALFSKKSKETFLPYDVLSENIHEIDYKTALARLIEEGKYRLAVRLLYLQSLKKLSDNNKIDWRPEKTNYNYFMEINEPNLKSEFGQLTHQFDYIWYGDFPVDKLKFDPINQTFSHFNAQIK
ncbi:hypothetical protein ABIB40_000469 [Pedobacter sp. UYP30]|uniref:DUF4129 domain-containing protein n=1 Tax=Pedobacter sp. UYP30 TaxID=1756400 RepID=UPI0033980E5A